jgi:hypothetical protein
MMMIAVAAREEEGGAAAGTCGVWVTMRINDSCMVPMRKFSQATEFEGEAFRTV